MHSQEQVRRLSLTGVLITLGRGRLHFAAVLILGLMITALCTGYYPRAYVATTIVLPPQQSNSAAASMLAQFDGISPIAQVKTPDELYVALLAGRHVQTQVIEGLKLREAYNVDNVEQARKVMAANVLIVAEKKSGLITIKVEDRDAQRAASIANLHVSALKQLLSRMAVTDAQKRRSYFEQMVQKSKKGFEDAEQRFLRERASGGWVFTQSEAEYGIYERASIRGRLAAKRIELNTLAQYMTPRSPEYQRVVAEIAAMQRQMNTSDEAQLTGEAIASTQRGGALQAYRDMKLQEALIESMTKQLELARADEAKEGPPLQQVEDAIPPEAPSKPRRAFIVLLGTLLTLLAATAVGYAKGNVGSVNEEWQRVWRAWVGKH
jgi:tyrosine-protein kinase Etk/Wzc